MIYDIIKIKLASKYCQASPCSDLSTKKSLNLTIGYLGNQF